MPKAPGTARGSITVSAWTMLSRLTGLLRVVVIGAVLGPTFFANAFLTANSVPNLTYTAMAGPVMAMVLVPAVARAVGRSDDAARLAATAEMMSRINGYLLTLAGLAAGALALVSPLVAYAVTAGIPDPGTRNHAWKLTILIVLFVAPQVVCYTIAGIGEAVQQARGRFALAAAAPALESIGLMATMVLVVVFFSPGAEVSDVSISMVLVLGLGSTLSVVLHAGAQAYGAHKVGLPIRIRSGWKSDPAATEVTKRLRRSVIVAVFPPASMFAMAALAATVPGGTFVLQAGFSVFFFVGALGAKAVTTAALPGMSNAFEADDLSRFASAWRQALSLAVTASLPAGALLFIFAEPAASVLVNGSLRTPEILGWLSICLRVFAIAVIFNAVHEIARQTMFARLDVRGPRLLSTLVLVIRVGVGLGCLLLPAGEPRLFGLASAVLVGETVGAIVGLWMTRRAIHPERMLERARLVRTGLATVAMLPAAVFGAWLINSRIHERLLRILTSAGFGLVSTLCFAVVLALLSGQMSTLIRKVRRRLSPAG